MGKTDFGARYSVALVAFDFCLRPAVLRFAVSWLWFQADGVLSRESDPVRPGSVLASLASLLWQGVFWQMDVLQTIINQGHPD